MENLEKHPNYNKGSDLSESEYEYRELTEDELIKRINIFELSDEQTRSIGRCIRQNDGLIRIFVHPYYEDFAEESDPEASSKLENPSLSSLVWEAKKLKMQAIMERILSSDPEKTPFIFIMEEGKNIRGLMKLIKNKRRNLACIIPTYQDTSEPKFMPEGTPGENQISSEENWKKLIEKLKILDVKKIIIGGAYLSIDYDDKKEKPKLASCVGDAVNCLSDDFEMEISNAIFPCSKEDLRKAKNKYKSEKQNEV